MQLGMVGLGRMGANMVRRLMRGGHECVVFDLSQDNVKHMAAEGAVGAASMEDFVKKLKHPRAAWVMVPAGEATEHTVMQLADLMESGDSIIDGGNSYYKDDIRRAHALRPKGIGYVDVGTSGGVWGLERGYCMMLGGHRGAVERLTRFSRRWRRGLATSSALPGAKARRAPRSKATCIAANRGPGIS